MDSGRFAGFYRKGSETLHAFSRLASRHVSRSQGVEESADLVVNVAGIGQGLRDLGKQEVAKAATHAVGCDHGGDFGDA